MRAYNPLSVEELGRNAALAVMKWPAVPLPPPELDEGAGVYTIHYRGSFEAYASMEDEEPIYVGQAVLTKTKPRPLRQRLSDHQRSIESAENLELVDFRCRWIVLDPVWIGLTEQMLIERYRPIWNIIVAGFGNHDQGGTRTTQERSLWDTLHPGRAWSAKQRDNRMTAANILQNIAFHRGRRS